MSVNAACTAGRELRKSRVVSVQSRNGEIHLILAEYVPINKTEKAVDFDETTIRRIMKKEVSKPLLLVRSE
jgi:hypothetical protein